MVTFFASMIVPDPEAFIEGSKSHPKEYLDERGIIEQALFRVVGENRVLIVGTYNTLEEARNHKAEIESSEVEAQMKQMGVTLPMDLWIAEKA